MCKSTRGQRILTTCRIRKYVQIPFDTYPSHLSKPKRSWPQAQRHWMEITTSLPVLDWYEQTSENDLQQLRRKFAFTAWHILVLHHNQLMCMYLMPSLPLQATPIPVEVLGGIGAWIIHLSRPSTPGCSGRWPALSLRERAVVAKIQLWALD